MLGRRYEDDFNQFHDFEHWPGFCLMAIRLALCALFLVGGLSTIRNTNMESLKAFMLKLLALGALWFLAMPCMVRCCANSQPQTLKSATRAYAQNDD